MENIGSWLRENKKLIAVVASILVIAIILILIGYQLDWTGFNAYDVTVQTNANKGATLPTKITVTLPSKTLYDWMQLLIIPFVIAVSGYVINLTISRGEQEATEQRDKTERDLALDRQHEATLREYIDKMSNIILHENLRTSNPKDEVRKIARVWTALAFNRLDKYRKGDMVDFLRISNLIDSDRIIDLTDVMIEKAYLYDMYLSGLNFSGADLEGSDLSYSELRSADLSGSYLLNADLHNADLRGANLYNANLSGANLRLANVSIEQLSKAKSLKGATMPDGSIHE